MFLQLCKLCRQCLKFPLGQFAKSCQDPSGAVSAHLQEFLAAFPHVPWRKLGHFLHIYLLYSTSTLYLLLRIINRRQNRKMFYPSVVSLLINAISDHTTFSQTQNGVTYPLREEYKLLHIRREVLTWFLELQCLNE